MFLPQQAHYPLSAAGSGSISFHPLRQQSQETEEGSIAIVAHNIRLLNCMFNFRPRPSSRHSRSLALPSLRRGPPFWEQFPLTLKIVQELPKVRHRGVLVVNSTRVTNHAVFVLDSQAICIDDAGEGGGRLVGEFVPVLRD